MTLPGTLASIYYDTLVQSTSGMILLNLGDSIDNTYHSLSFFILIMTNKKIYKNTRNLVQC